MVIKVRVTTQMLNGSLMEFYTTPELLKVVERDYKILKIYEVWHYPKFADLFSSFINTFMAAKVKNSGWPKSVKTVDEKPAYFARLFARDASGSR